LKKRVIHLFQQSLAWLFIVVGFVFFISPIPIGVVLLAIGLSLLVFTNDKAAEKVRKLREKYHKLNIKLIAAEDKLNGRLKFVSVAMNRTRPVTERS